MAKALRVLIVEDNEDDVEFLLQELRRGGYEPTFKRVDTAAALKAALEGAEWDIIISDYKMPQFDAIAALAMVREKRLDLPFIIVTGTIGEDVAVEAMRLGVHDYFMKGNLQRLLPAIKRELRDSDSRRLRRQTQTALRKSEEKYRRLFESAIDMIHIVDAQHRIIDVNETELRKLGYSRSEMIGRPLLDFIHPICHSITKVKIPGVRAGRAVTSYETALRTKDGDAIWVDANVVPMMVDGTFCGAQAILHDITERKQTEERFRAAFEQAAVGMGHVRLDGTFLRVNDTFSRMLGYERDQLVGKRVCAVTHPDYIASDRERVRQLLQGEIETFTKEKRYLRRDGSEVWGEVNVSLVRKGDGEIEYMSFVCKDITSRKEIEEQLRQSQKMEAVGRLAGGVAHDFNNMLTIILGHTEMILDHRLEGERARKNIESIRRAGERAATLTRQLLAFSRRQILQPRVLDLNGVVTDINSMLHRLIGEDIELVSVTSPGLWKVHADPGQIEQIIMNLTVNARDAMPLGGRLTIEVKNVEVDEDYVRQRPLVKPGSYVMLAASDTGCGMDAETQERIFEPFFTTKDPGKGTGLGLATVYGIVKQSGGYVWVYSELGKGTTFRIYLPRVEEVAQVVAPVKPIPQPKGTETILLVEDEEALREMAGEILRVQGYTVLEAAHGEEALALYEKTGEPIHLLLTDVIMPRMSGRELADKLKDSQPELEVLFTSGYTDDAIVHHHVLDEGTHFLEKPFTPSTLLQKVREVMQGRPTENL